MINNLDKLTSKELAAFTKLTLSVHTKELKEKFQNPFPKKEEWVSHETEDNKEYRKEAR